MLKSKFKHTFYISISSHFDEVAYLAQEVSLVANLISLKPEDSIGMSSSASV